MKELGYHGIRTKYRYSIEAADKEVLNLDDNSQLDCFLTEIINTLDEIQKECIKSTKLVYNEEEEVI